MKRGEARGVAHVEEEELEEALVREDVEHVAGGAVDDRQSVHAVLDQHAHRLQQRLVRRDRDERLVARQRVCTANVHTNANATWPSADCDSDSDMDEMGAKEKAKRWEDDADGDAERERETRRGEEDKQREKRS